MTTSPLYFDSAATTKICPQALDAMCREMEGNYGNPSSLHPLGKQAAKKLQENRGTVAAALGCLPEELYFTSGGTEGNNWAISAALHMMRRQGKHIITTMLEHASVLEPIRHLEQQGYEVTYLPPGKDGIVSVEDLGEALRPDTVLCSMMLVNNETGAVQPVAEAAQEIARRGSPCLLHTDAVQGFLKVPFTPKDLGADFVTVSGHKVGGPRGVGALHVKKGLRMLPLLHGGGQESGLRPGTEPGPLIAGLAAACEAGADTGAAISQVKAYAIAALGRRIPQIVRITDGAAPHILCLAWPGHKSEVLVRVLGDLGVCVSAGSACHRGKASHVYEALRLPPAVKDGAFRVSFSMETGEDEVDRLIDALIQADGALLSL